MLFVAIVLLFVCLFCSCFVKLLLIILFLRIETDQEIPQLQTTEKSTDFNENEHLLSVNCYSSFNFECKSFLKYNIVF